MSANSPKPWDSDNDLLAKLLRIFGGSPQPTDGANTLLQKLVRAAEAADAGIESLAYAASVALDFSTSPDKTITLGGDLELTTSGLAAGREVSLRIIADGSTRSFTFPAGWTFIGAAPSDIAAGKTGVLSLKSYGTGDANIVAAYAVEE